MKDADTTTEKPTPRPLFPELDTGICLLALYLRQYIKSLRQLEKVPVRR